VDIVPNHACVVTNMVDNVYVTAGNGTYETWPVAARGRIY
jgi:D-serine deaminase-like pyridoxal phosphate-dependent protein